MFGNECRGIPSSSGDALTATPLDCHEERGRHGSILPPVMAHQQVERTTGRDETMVFSEGPPSLWRCAAILPRAQEMHFSLVSGQIWCPKVSKRRAESPLGAYHSEGIDAPTVAKEKCAKESQRHGDSRGGPRRYALRPSPALRLGLATRFMAFSHFWR